MENIPSFNALIKKTILDNWDKDALTDFKGATLQYHDVARKIEKLHMLKAIRLLLQDAIVQTGL